MTLARTEARSEALLVRCSVSIRGSEARILVSCRSASARTGIRRTSPSLGQWKVLFGSHSRTQLGLCEAEASALQGLRTDFASRYQSKYSIRLSVLAEQRSRFQRSLSMRRGCTASVRSRRLSGRPSSRSPAGMSERRIATLDRSPQKSWSCLHELVCSQAELRSKFASMDASFKNWRVGVGVGRGVCLVFRAFREFIAFDSGVDYGSMAWSFSA